MQDFLDLALFVFGARYFLVAECTHNVEQHPWLLTVSCHSFLQEIFLTQGLNPCLLHYRQILCALSHKGSTPRQHIKKQRLYYANKGPSSQGYGFASGHVWM